MTDDMSALLAQCHTIETKLVELSAHIVNLTAYGRRNRRLIRLLAVSLVLDVVLSLGLGWVAFNAKEASDSARRATTAAALVATDAHATCLTSNEARAVQHDLWKYVLNVPPSRPLTATESGQRAQFRTYIDATLAPRDCDKVAPVLRH